MAVQSTIVLNLGFLELFLGEMSREYSESNYNPPRWHRSDPG